MRTPCTFHPNLGHLLRCLRQQRQFHCVPLSLSSCQMPLFCRICDAQPLPLISGRAARPRRTAGPRPLSSCPRAICSIQAVPGRARLRFSPCAGASRMLWWTTQCFESTSLSRTSHPAVVLRKDGPSSSRMSARERSVAHRALRASTPSPSALASFVLACAPPILASESSFIAAGSVNVMVYISESPRSALSDDGAGSGFATDGGAPDCVS